MANPYELEETELWQSKIVKHTEENPEDLLAHPLNFRIHSEFQQSVTVGSLDALGWVKSVIVNINTQTVIDGHERIILAMRKPGQTVPVEWVDLTEDQEAVALMSLDHIASLAGIDADKLSEIATAVDFDLLGDIDFSGMLTEFVDAFSGSGTTIIAAENLARQCRAVEISPAYVAVALDRYERAFNIKPELII